MAGVLGLPIPSGKASNGFECLCGTRNGECFVSDIRGSTKDGLPSSLRRLGGVGGTDGGTDEVCCVTGFEHAQPKPHELES